MKRFKAIATVIIIFDPSVGWAHGGEARGAGGYWIAAVLIGLAVLHLVFRRGMLHLQRTSGSVNAAPSVLRTVAFIGGEMALAIALASPLERLSEESLTLHMVQHLLLIIVAPVLFVLARPRRSLAAAFPQATRFLARYGGGVIGTHFRVFRHPLRAAMLHSVVLWLWHLPAAFNVAVENIYWHMAEHACFLITAIVFWSSILRAGRVRSAFPAAFLALTVTVILGGMLGAWLSLAPELIYARAGLGRHFGLDPIADQQLAGLLMWVPAGLVYMAVALFLTAAFLRGVELGERNGRHSVLKPEADKRQGESA